ncbi:MAG: hypothetical protein CO170_01060 [candidate division SR1 bacterium CG_4_9_14_3_um_filter_40_9]|nr:MAG: hypothetical protein CO170_01060 [candidate division SR1 bacterium CG_4_9_14_3_um_filter_40_9]
MSDFSKKYNAEAVENEITALRKEEDFSPDSKDSKTFISLPLPTSTNLHLGHAENVVLQDILARYYHMIDKKAEFRPSRYYGSFLANEHIQRQLKKIGTSKEKISKAQFWDVMQQHIKRQKKHNEHQLQKLGIGMDFERLPNGQTSSPSTFGLHFSRFLRKLFYQLVQDDIIYEAEDIVYWNTKYQTSLGRDEVKFEKQKGKKYTIKYFISTKNNSVNVVTTSPETIFGDVALAVHPDNKRYHNLIGQKAIIPIVNRTIPIIADARVDMFANNGIIRITPAHDLFSLQIAKDHKLPVDHFAIDQDGCFTKHAGDFDGKKVDEFMGNILQNLDDIDNMVSVENCDYEVPMCKKTGEKLQVMCLVQRFLHVEKAKEKLSLSIDNGTVKTFPARYISSLKEHLDTIDRWCISKNYLFGQGLPIWISENKGMIYVLDEVDVLESYKRDKNKQKLKVILSLIIFNLIADGRLNATFEMDHLMTILLTTNVGSDQTVLQTYIDTMDKELGVYTPQLKELKEVMHYAGKDKGVNLENFAASFIKILDASFAIKQVSDQKYQFDVDKLIQRDKGLRQEKSKFDISFVNAALILYSLGIFDEKKGKSKFRPALMVSGENVLLEINKVLLLSLELKDILLCDTIFINKTFCDAKKKKMGALCDNNIDPADLVREFGADTTRLYLMLEGDELATFDHSKIHTYEEFINKFWNASRYIALKAERSYGKKKITLSTLEKELEKNVLNLQDFDLWILNKIRNLYQDVDVYIFSNNVSEFGKKLLQIIKNDFCDKYLEVSKNSKSPLTEKVMLLVVSKMLKLLWPFAPFVSEKLRMLMGFQGYLSEQRLQGDFLEAINKNYKIQLFMDIIDKLLAIKDGLSCKKHTPVDTFIKANPDFLRFTKSNEATIKKIVNINKMEYLNINDDHPCGYTTEDIIDMTVGLKVGHVIHIEEKPKGVIELKKEFDQMNDYLQYLKNTVSAMVVHKSKEDEIEKKRKEITKAKKAILEMEYEINKLKTK